MTAPTSAQLRAHERRVAAMMADQECVGELLLAGIAMARAVDLDDPPFVEGCTLGVFADIVYGRYVYETKTTFHGETVVHRRWPGRDQFRAVIRKDIRRYQPAEGRGFHSTSCGRPMVRREGLCGANASSNHTSRLTDPATGFQSWVGACTNRPCRDWFAALVARNAAQLAATPAPIPAANTGGVLDRHLPEIDWYAIWRHLDERWTPPPEAQAWTPPKLTLVVDDDREVAEPAVGGRPTLTVIEGGWR